jgi:DNA-binding response OmpR family regulator
MRIAIVGGNVEDERHLGRLCEKAGVAPSFVQSALGALDEAPASSQLGVLDRAIERLGGAAASVEEVAVSGADPRPRAIVIEAAERGDVALRVLANLRRDPYFERVPALLMLPAMHAEALALPGGFDDFVLSPCSVDEVSIRIRALSRRRTESARGSEESAGVIVDEQSRTVVVDGHGIQLTAREFALFTYLCEWRGRVLSREHLLARVWGSRYSGGRRTVDIHVRRLRAKLGASLAIETLRGSGYRLRRDPTPAEPAQIPEPFSKVS